MVWERFQVSPLMHGSCPSNSKLFWDFHGKSNGYYENSLRCSPHNHHLAKRIACWIRGLHVTYDSSVTPRQTYYMYHRISKHMFTTEVYHCMTHNSLVGAHCSFETRGKHFECRHFLRWQVGRWAWIFSMERSFLQGGPLVVIDGVITPLIGVITPVTYLFSAIYRAYITPFITIVGVPPCMFFLSYPWFEGCTKVIIAQYFFLLRDSHEYNWKACYPHQTITRIP